MIAQHCAAPSRVGRRGPPAAALLLLLLLILATAAGAEATGPRRLVPAAATGPVAAGTVQGGDATAPPAAAEPLQPRLDWRSTRGAVGVSGRREGGRSVLQFATPPGTAAAFFLRPGRLAAVLATEPTEERLDAHDLAFRTGLRLVEKKLLDGATVYWFELPRTFALEVGRQGAGGWRVVLHEGSAASRAPPVDPAPALAGLRGEPLYILDEAAGERLAVVPSTMPGSSAGGAVLADREFLPAGLGIVWRRREPPPTAAPPVPAMPRLPDPQAPSIEQAVAPPPVPDVPPLATQVAVTPEPTVAADASGALQPALPAQHSLLGLASWRLAPGETFLQRKRRLEAELVARLPAARLPVLLALARLHLAHTQPSEALVRLQQAGELSAADPRAGAELQALRAAAGLLRGGAEPADPPPSGDTELALWQAVLASTEVPPADLLPADYPPALQRRLGLELAEGLAREERFAELRPLADRLLALRPAAGEKGRLLRLKAQTQERLGSWRDAVLTLEQLAAGGGRHAMPALVERARLGVERGDLLAEPTLERLAKLMPLWRGHVEEAGMLRFLATLAEENARPLLAVEAWQQLLASETGDAAGEAGAAFERLLAQLLGEGSGDPAELMAALDIAGRLSPDSLARPETAALAGRLADGLAAAGLPLAAARLLERTAGASAGPSRAARLATAAGYALDADDPALAHSLLDRLGPPVTDENGQVRRLRARVALATGAPEAALALLQADGISADDPLAAQAALAAGRLDLLAAAMGEAVPEQPEQRLALALALATTGNEAGLQRLAEAERAMAEPAAAALAPQLAGPLPEVVAALNRETVALRRLLGIAPPRPPSRRAAERR
ncbi:hypothetical protein SH611_09045 [Geminicoccaceae bacterium 1502E]|nr:hypothetical protein [Geminicoccaceae bacterium 1502E]